MSKTFFIDLALCTDCNNCLMACKDEHCGNEFAGYTAEQPRHGHRWIDIMYRERGTYPRLDVAFLPKPCMNCKSPACADGDAVYTRADGIVMIDPEKAKGNKTLVEKCPYGAIYWNEEKNVPQKCTTCSHLLDDGWKQPRCSDACPTGALTWRDESEAQSGEWQVLNPEFGTGPRVYYKNLHRYERDFITGSADLGGDCLEGATAVLLDAKGEKLREQLTNAFGEFKFDNLETGKEYTVVLSMGDKKAERHLLLETTTDLDVIALD
jgi:Fe-S-cluster-containing dehydrogenase component